MTTQPESMQHMMAAWNERDPEKIRGHLDKALAPDVIFCDPKYDIQGIDAFEAMVRQFRKDYPDAFNSLTSGLDHHHDLYRYEWLVSVGGQPAQPGMDVTRLNADGLVQRVDGFFGPVPQA